MQTILKKQKISIVPIVLLLPALTLLAVFSIYPVFNAFFLSFYNKQMLAPGKTFIGLGNYIHLFQDAAFMNSLKVTVLYVGGSVLLQFLMGLIIASLLCVKDLKGRAIFRTLIILPYTLSELVVSLIWLRMLDPQSGVINYIISLFGAQPVNWLFHWALPVVILVNVWWGTTFSLLMFESAMQGIPQSLYEAAEVDGASVFQRFIYITLPALKYISLLVLIMITLYTINSFGIIFVLTAGGPVGATNVIGMYMWNNAFQSSDLGLGATISTIIFIVNIVITLIYIRGFGMSTMERRD
ncbi:sugar ABC transporter permease [Sporolactobacillus shoreae]|uniref:Sugar ABC transporter permease n=1 Tax=Sporolactobacillus shoreae TaxID=1465501 RepID=A0A4Z0GR80_9BACL|nr:sugar ABC transporter permease [Sporolactobacillus shoreae]TGA99829.1 sugar ABC transporter permease [Sporolactobacillus shoreae]